MDGIKASQERKISILAHQPRHIINGMIKITQLKRPSSTWRISSSSSLGDLDALSLEILHLILARLDFKSLSHISKTCIRGRAIVTSLPQYRDVMRHAPQVLAALGKTKPIRHHASADIHATLISTRCVSCTHFGAFLFLPTCERCCYHCLWRNQSLWVVPVSIAKKAFGFSEAGAKTLPKMRSIPGNYYVGYFISRQRSIGLVSVGSAKKLALLENISEEHMRQDLEKRRSAGLSIKEYHMLRFLQATRLTPPGPDFFVKHAESNTPNDMYCGMASIPFPYLVPGRDAENGLWCLGCEAFSRQWTRSDRPPDHLSHIVPPGRLVADIVRDMQSVAR